MIYVTVICMEVCIAQLGLHSCWVEKNETLNGIDFHGKIIIYLISIKKISLITLWITEMCKRIYCNRYYSRKEGKDTARSLYSILCPLASIVLSLLFFTISLRVCDLNWAMKNINWEQKRSVLSGRGKEGPYVVA